ncbi:DUF3883 domain-containing protein [Peribacillus frigoritolerans]|uniref:DUF3883 domain-containing protein n=1 Tax=Peribacillus frigoritolerans TaxID=450367 RepID=UPI00399F8A44
MRRKRSIDTKKYEELRSERDRRNKEIGNLAEEFVYKREKNRLISLGLSELSNNIDWISKREDGHGYDIKSFFLDGSVKYIEVKGSSLAQNDFTFYLSKTEKEVAEEYGDSYFLALVQNVGSDNVYLMKLVIQ